MTKFIRVVWAVCVVCGMVTTASAENVIVNPNFENNIPSGFGVSRLNGEPYQLSSGWGDPYGDSYLSGYSADDSGYIGRLPNTDPAIYAYVSAAQPGGGRTGLISQTNYGSEWIYQTVSLSVGDWAFSCSLASLYKDATLTEKLTDPDADIPLPPVTGDPDPAPYAALGLSLAVYQGQGVDAMWGTPIWDLSGDQTAAPVSIVAYLPEDNSWKTTVFDSFHITEAGEYTIFVQTQGVSWVSTDSYALTNLQLNRVPEPGTWAMLIGLGLIGVAWYRRFT